MCCFSRAAARSTSSNSDPHGNVPVHAFFCLLLFVVTLRAHYLWHDLTSLSPVLASPPLPPSGEFVALERLEQTFAASSLVEQLFLHADSTHSALVALVVPAAAVLARTLVRMMRKGARSRVANPTQCGWQ